MRHPAGAAQRRIIATTPGRRIKGAHRGRAPRIDCVAARRTAWPERWGVSFAGRIVAGADGTVFTADAVTLRVATADTQDPHRAAILIRPEDAEPAERYPFNRLAGQVASCSFLGRCWRLAVSVAGRDFRLDWHERVRVGEPFAFSVAPERCTIVPADGLCPAQ